MAPFEAVAKTLESVIDEIEKDDRLRNGKNRRDDRESDGNRDKGSIGIVDCCSGAGGPMPAIERKIK